MTLEKLSFFEIINIYKKRVLTDFPRAELKPLAAIVYYYLRGRYAGYGLKDGGDVAAYALILEVSGQSALIDYLAVDRARRGGGCGSALIRGLSEVYRACGIVIEVENPAFAPSPERHTEMIRRIGFYGRLGFVMAPVETRVFGVEFSIMTDPNVPGGAAGAAEQIAALYRALFPRYVLRRQVEIRAARDSD